jgi:2-polyprenyl-3-methyl-5-hydroxy-6-metoxy-1,4-benzoquinol methylase
MWQYKYQRKSVHEFNIQTLEIIKKYCSSSRCLDSIELGGGTGQLSYLLYQNNLVGQVSVIDSSPSAICYMIDYYNDMGVKENEYRLLKGDIFHYGGRYNNKFDIVLSSGLIEHFKGSRLKEICNIHKLLSEKYIIVVVPYDNERNRTFSLTDECKKKYGYQKPMNEKELDLLFTDSNFKKVHSEKYYKGDKLLIGIYERI